MQRNFATPAREFFDGIVQHVYCPRQQRLVDVFISSNATPHVTVSMPCMPWLQRLCWLQVGRNHRRKKC